MRSSSRRRLEAIAATPRSETPNLSPTTAVTCRPSCIFHDLDTNGVKCLRETKLFDFDDLSVSRLKYISNVLEKPSVSSHTSSYYLYSVQYDLNTNC